MNNRLRASIATLTFALATGGTLAACSSDSSSGDTQSGTSASAASKVSWADVQSGKLKPQDACARLFGVTDDASATTILSQLVTTPIPSGQKATLSSEKQDNRLLCTFGTKGSENNVFANLTVGPASALPSQESSIVAKSSSSPDLAVENHDAAENAGTGLHNIMQSAADNLTP